MGINLKIKPQRFWEIDFFRGIAILLMVSLHLLDDLYFFTRFPVRISPGLWFGWQRVTASLFLLLVGVSLILDWSKTERLKNSGLLSRLLIRGGKIFLWGIAVTIVTRIFLPEGYIVFGILHLIGISIILSFPFLKLGYWNLIYGTLFIGLGVFLNHFRVPFFGLLWLGLVPKQFFTVDYFPVLPWFGLVLLGIFLGKLLYRDHIRRFPLDDFTRYPMVKWLCILGRNSLAIYLIHQPLFVAFLYLAGFMKK